MAAAPPAWRRRLLWIDGGSGAAVGVVGLLAAPVIARWTGLPPGHVLLMAAANVVYGSYALALASRPVRPRALIAVLVGANAVWSVLCMAWLVRFAGDVTALGAASLGGEGLYVGGLAGLEWRARDLLRTAA